MIKLCIDNTSSLHEFHLFEPYFYGLIKDKNCFFVNDFSKDNSDIVKVGITVCNAESILLEHFGEEYEVIVVTEFFENDDLLKKLYEIDKYIAKSFTSSKIQKTRNVTVIILDYTGNSYVNFCDNMYVSKFKSDDIFCEEDLECCQKLLKDSKSRDEFIGKSNEIIAQKACKKEWYLYIFDKMKEHFYDNKLFNYNDNNQEKFSEIFKKIMSYYVKKELLDNKLIFRYDMFAKLDYRSSNERSFVDMNKIIALLTFDIGDLLLKTKQTLVKGIYNVNIGLDNEKIKAMIMQYSENLKSQLQFLLCNKVTSVKVEKRIMPNISLKNVFLEPVKIKNEKLTFFRSSRDMQYLDRIEKNITNSVNKRVIKVKRNNTQNVCDLRVLRYTDDRNNEFENLNLIELKEKINEKQREYKNKNFDAYKNKVNYYKILDEFLEKQKGEKADILLLMQGKIKLKQFLAFAAVLFLVIIMFILISCQHFTSLISDKALLCKTIGCFFGFNVVGALAVIAMDNSRINKRIDKYLEVVNEYNSKLQIGSNDEIEKLSRTYELILLNSDIEYYNKKYNELVNDIGKYEFHIAQIEKHINMAKRLCDRIGVNFEEIIIADDTSTDEIIADIDINKDVYNNDCYNIMNFLFNTKDYCLMLNSGEVIEQSAMKTYIKSINFTEDEVYRF